MSLSISNDASPASTRFQVLVNGSFEGDAFASLENAVETLQAYRGSNSFQIHDTKLSRNVWARPRPDESHGRGRFGLRRNGAYCCKSFDTLAAAIMAIPPGDFFNLYEVFDDGQRLFTFGLGIDPIKYSRGVEVPSDPLVKMLEEDD